MRHVIRPEPMPENPARTDVAPAPKVRKRQRTHRGIPAIPPAPVSDTIQPEFIVPEHQTNAINPPPFDGRSPEIVSKPESGVRLKVDAPKRIFDPSVRWRNEAKAALEAYASAEDDWEKRLQLIKLADFIAEARYGLGDARHGQELQKMLNKIPERGEVRHEMIRGIIDEAERLLEGRPERQDWI